MNSIRMIMVFAAFIMVQGCVSLLPDGNPPKPRYQITAAAGDALSGPEVAWSLTVDDPRATRVYDSMHITVADAPGKVSYLASGEWADRAPRLFQTALVQTFEDSGRILSVGDRNALPIADFVLQTDIRKLELTAHSGDRSATVSIFARLTDGKGGIYAARKFDASVDAAGLRGGEIANAFNQAFDTILAEIVRWSFDEGARISDGGDATG